MMRVPVPRLAESPSIHDVADKLKLRASHGAQKVGQEFRTASARAQMNVRNEHAAILPGRFGVLHVDQLFLMPSWVGEEVTHDPRYRKVTILARLLHDGRREQARMKTAPEQALSDVRPGWIVGIIPLEP